MPPKVGAKPAKTTAVASSDTPPIASFVAADTALSKRLADSVSDMKALLLRQQQDVDALVASKEGVLKKELLVATARIFELEASVRDAKTEATAVKELTTQRASLLARVSVLEAERSLLLTNHASAVSAMSRHVATLQDRLQAAFSQTLSGALMKEERRVTAELGQAAALAATQAALHAGLSSSTQQLARVGHVVRDLEHENARLRLECVSSERAGLEQVR